MNTYIYVTRLESRQTDEWTYACKNNDKNPTGIFKVVSNNSLKYALEGVPNLWDITAFRVVPLEETPGYRALVALLERESPKEKDAVINPNHYDMMGANTIEILASAMTEAEWRGFCLGNTLKYRIRAGKKDDLQQDIDKANNYERLYEKHKHLCRKDKEKSEE